MFASKTLDDCKPLQVAPDVRGAAAPGERRGSGTRLARCVGERDGPVGPLPGEVGLVAPEMSEHRGRAVESAARD